MNIETLLIRMAKWSRRPPSRRRIAMFVVIIAIGLGLAAIEKAGLWPDWAHAERIGNPARHLP